MGVEKHVLDPNHHSAERLAKALEEVLALEQNPKIHRIKVESVYNGWGWNFIVKVNSVKDYVDEFCEYFGLSKDGD